MSTDLQEWSTHLPASLVVFDENLDLVDASRTAFSLFRVRYHSADKPRSLEELSRYLLGKPSFVSAVGEASLKLTRLGSQNRLRWHEGDRVFDITISTMPPEDHMHYGLHFQDVTKMIEFERSREVTRNYLEQIIDSLPVGIVVMDCDMSITAMNRVQQEFLKHGGRQSALLDAVGTPLYDLLPEYASISWRQIASQLFVNVEAIRDIEYSCMVGEEERTFSVSIIPLVQAGGEVIGGMHLTEDITDKLRMLADAHESEMLSARLETLQQTVVTLNHVINNKLMGMMCSFEIIRSTGAALSEDKQKVLMDAMNEAESIAQFIRDLADIREVKTIDYLKDGEKMLDIYTSNPDYDSCQPLQENNPPSEQTRATGS